MIEKPMDILTQFPVRRTKQQKQAFRDAVCSFAAGIGYETTVEENKKDCHNVIIGDLKRAKYLVSAHYDTPASIGIPNVMIPCNKVLFIAYQLVVVCFLLLPAFLVGGAVWLATNDQSVSYLAGYAVYMVLMMLMLFGPANKNNVNDNSSGVITLLEIARTLPEDLREQVCFILFDKEEYGLVGSKAYRKAHKEDTENKLLLNLDCVGNGDHITLFPNKKIRLDTELMDKLNRIGGQFGEKQINVHEKNFKFNSDQKNYPLGVGIGAFHKKKFVGLYCGRIHTKRDTILQEENINILRDRLTAFLAD